jgi:hypothetical protein
MASAAILSTLYYFLKPLVGDQLALLLRLLLWGAFIHQAWRTLRRFSSGKAN